jgi:hypothetical protein
MKLKIEKGFFYGAGSPKVYNWVKDGFHIYGVGVNLDLLKISRLKHEPVEIEIDGEHYELDSQTALEFINNYNSIEKRKGTSIGVVSKSLCVPVEN